MTDYFLCCFYGDSNEDQAKYTNKRNIDKTMIGLPTNFQHCTHIGCGDIAPNSRMNTVEIQRIGEPINQQRHNTLNSNNNNNNLVAHLKLIDLKNVA